MSSSKTIKQTRNLAAGDVYFERGVGDFAYQVVKIKIEVCKFNGDEYITLSILEKVRFLWNGTNRQATEVQWQERVSETVVKEIDKDALLGFKNSTNTFNMMQQLASYAKCKRKALSWRFFFRFWFLNNELGDEKKNCQRKIKKGKKILKWWTNFLMSLMTI